MYEDIAPGAAVACTDGRLGTVKQLVHDERHGYVTDLLVRRERTGELFRVPLRYVARVRTPKRVTLNCTLDQFEKETRAMAKHTGKRNYGATIIGLFRNADAAERAIVDLKRLGIHVGDISLAQKGGQRERSVGQQTGVSRIEPEGGLGGTSNLPGLGSDLVQAIENLGLAQDTAQRYADLVDAGNILLAVQCDSQSDNVRSAFERHGAFDLRSSPRDGRVRPGRLRRDLAPA